MSYTEQCVHYTRLQLRHTIAETGPLVTPLSKSYRYIEVAVPHLLLLPSNDTRTKYQLIHSVDHEHLTRLTMGESTANTSRIDVLIVGAGPAGLMTAQWMSRLNVKTRIIDKRGTKVLTSNHNYSIHN